MFFCSSFVQEHAISIPAVEDCHRNLVAAVRDLDDRFDSRVEESQQSRRVQPNQHMQAMQLYWPLEDHRESYIANNSREQNE